MARDDLMSHIHRCGVLKASPEHQAEWMKETIEYVGETYASLSDAQLSELRLIGERFCQPVIPHGKAFTALNMPEAQAAETPSAEDEATENPELAGV
ncbi:MAG TPA: hypothetical protein VFZ18_07070 [Longimicrobiaceae bacterium]|jgi:hypothetical protein